MAAARRRTLASPMQTFMVAWPVAGRQGFVPPVGLVCTWNRPSRGSAASFGPTALASVRDGRLPRAGSTYAKIGFWQSAWKYAQWQAPLKSAFDAAAYFSRSEER